MTSKVVVHPPTAVGALGRREKDELRRDIQQLREQMKVASLTEVAVSQQQLTSLQARLEAIHAAKLLTDDELYRTEDMIADFVELESRAAAKLVTLEIVHTNEITSKVLTLVALSERIAVDGTFSRQLRRKYL